MDYRVNRCILVLVLGVSMIFSGCSSDAVSAPEALTISTAASLSDTMEEIASRYAEDHPEIKLAMNFGSSGSLRQQIEQGAEVDLFMPAALKDLEALQEQGLLLEGSLRRIVGNELVLIVPAGSQLPLGGFGDVTSPDVKHLALGEPASSPAGKYAQEVFSYLGILDTVKEKAVYAKDVKEVLTWVETENAEAGVVYYSDAMASDRVKAVAAAPADAHTPIIYSAAVIKASKHPEAAQAFLDYLSSDRAKTVFEKYGYVFWEEQ